MKIKEDLLNQRFGKLLVIESASNIDGRSAWKCRCDCGNVKNITSKILKNGIKSCGCVKFKTTPEEGTARVIWKGRYSDGDLSFEDFYRLSQQTCYYCGEAPVNKINTYISKRNSKFAKDNGNFLYNGLDRIDSSLPHTLDNVVTCCKWCNYSKRERSVDDFRSWIKDLYNKIKDLDINNINNINTEILNEKN